MIPEEQKTGASDMITSSFVRFLEVGGLVGRVGLSILGRRGLALFLGDDHRARMLGEMWSRNGERILKTLGRLKGGIMKAGQMLSLQDSLLPDEVLQVIRFLQKDAPPVSFDSMRTVLEEDIPGYREIFDYIEEKPFASASIGQVHKARLMDGELVAVKIQYPDMEQVIKGDLKNLRILFRVLFSSILKVDMKAIWNELNTRLLEELDYVAERRNQERFIELFADRDDVVIPRVFPRASGNRVLTTEFLPSPSETAMEPESLSSGRRDHFGRLLFSLFLIQFLRFRFLHCDPNFANYGLLSDGRLVIYDFGSVKTVPPGIAENYRDFFIALFEGRAADTPEILRRIGVQHSDGRSVELGTVQELIDIFRPVFSENPYCFESGAQMFDRIIELKTKHMLDSLDIVFPSDIIFIHRAMGGLFGNLNRLKACGDWTAIAREAIYPE